jgi:hypothetical protein
MPEQSHVHVHVFCLVCGQKWDPSDPGVLYRSADRQWWCADEVACRSRRAGHGVPEGVVFSEDAVRALGHAFGQMPPMRPGK